MPVEMLLKMRIIVDQTNTDPQLHTDGEILGALDKPQGRHWNET